ncbi:hypothetical protein ASPCAL00757 [Aspergillus calidoustus]|nr:hypothetical protein ASPCAL00757 [Aspergillus calidoustus]
MLIRPIQYQKSGMSSSRSWSVLFILLLPTQPLIFKRRPRILHELCEAAPDVARAIAGTIQGNKTVPSEQQVNANTALLKRKWKPDQDPPYRP